MDYIIDIQGLREKDNKFLPKEVAVVPLQGNIIGHWIIIPPHESDGLPNSIKTTNDYVLSHILGIHWFDGDITLRKLHYHVYNIARNARKIYVKSSENTRYVQSIMTRTVVDVAEYINSGYTDLENQSSCEKLYTFHAFQPDEYKKTYCAVHASNIVREWFYSLLSDSYELKRFPEEGGELFYHLRQNIAWTRRNNTAVTFAFETPGEGRDDVHSDSLD